MALTRAQISEARRLLREGVPRSRVAPRLGCSYASLMRGLGLREKRIYLDGDEVFVPTKADIAARLAEIPEQDDRGLTAFLMGDPNPADRRRRVA